MPIHIGLMFIRFMRNNHKNIIAVAAAAVLMAVGIHLTQEFRFYNIESNDLFLYDWADIWMKLCKTGGLATVLGSFLTQFFRIPFVGTAVVTVLYLLTACMIGALMSGIAKSRIMSGLSFLPVAFLFLCLENDYYRFQGHIGFMLVMAMLLIYQALKNKSWRYLAGALMIPLLYQAAGSVTVVFAVCLLLMEILENGLKGLWALVYPLVLCCTAALYVECSLVDSWEHALTPFMYYDWPSTYFFPIYAWVLVPVLIVVAWLAGRLNFSSTVIKTAVILGAAFSFFLAGNFYMKVHSKSFYRLIQEQYWAENEEWDKIIQTADRRQPTFLVSYLNLALAQKGLLVQNFRYYNPQDLSSLMYPTPNLKTGLSLQSNVYLAWGYLGSGRKAAFDGNVVTPGSCHPRQLQALIQANLVLESYGAAEKYIRILEKTLFYRKWASSMRHFIDNPQAVRSDETLGRMYSSLPLTDEYARYDGMQGDMRDMMEANPSNHILAQFHELYKILEDSQR